MPLSDIDMCSAYTFADSKALAAQSACTLSTAYWAASAGNASPYSEVSWS